MSDNDVELDDEAKQLKLQLLKEETRNTIAETRNAALIADLNAIKSVITDAETKLIAEPVKLDQVGGESLVPVVAADRLNEIAEVIAAQLVEHQLNGRVLVVDDRSVAQSDVVYLAVRDRIEQIHRDFATMEEALRKGITPAPTPTPQEPPTPPKNGAAEEPGKPEALGLAAVTTLASLAVNVAGLFKQEFTVVPRAVAVDASALVAEIARHVKGRVTMVLPGFALIKESALSKRFHETLGQRLALDLAIAEAEAVDGDAATAGSEGDPVALARRANVATAKALVEAFTQFVTDITGVPSGGTHSPLTAAVLREQIHGLEEEGGQTTALMHVAVTAKGGDAVTKKAFMWGGQQAAFLAAVQATYVVATTRGEILASGAVTRFGAIDYDFSKLTQLTSLAPRKPTA